MGIFLLTSGVNQSPTYAEIILSRLQKFIIYDSVYKSEPIQIIQKCLNHFTACFFFPTWELPSTHAHMTVKIKQLSLTFSKAWTKFLFCEIIGLKLGCSLKI